MKKIFLILVCLVLVLAIGAGIWAGPFLSERLKTAVNDTGAKALQSPVALASARLSPFGGTATLSGLTVGNPAGWSSRQALAFGELRLDVSLFSLLKQTIVVNELVIDRAQVTYEKTFPATNLTDLLGKSEDYYFSIRRPDEPGRKFIVKQLRLTHGTATVVDGAKSLEAPLPPISLENLGAAEGGITSDELTRRFANKLIHDIATVAAQAPASQWVTDEVLAEKLRETDRKVMEPLLERYDKNNRLEEMFPKK